MQKGESVSQSTRNVYEIVLKAWREFLREKEIVETDVPLDIALLARFVEIRQREKYKTVVIPALRWWYKLQGLPQPPQNFSESNVEEWHTTVLLHLLLERAKTNKAELGSLVTQNGYDKTLSILLARAI